MSGTRLPGQAPQASGLHSPLCVTAESHLLSLTQGTVTTTDHPLMQCSQTRDSHHWTDTLQNPESNQPFLLQGKRVKLKISKQIQDFTTPAPEGDYRHRNHPKCGVRVQTLRSPKPVLLNPMYTVKPPEKLFRNRDARIPPPRHPNPGGLGWSLGLALVFMLLGDCDVQLELGTTALVQRFSKSIAREGTSKLPENLLKLPMPRPTPNLQNLKLWR